MEVLSWKQFCEAKQERFFVRPSLAAQTKNTDHNPVSKLTFESFVNLFKRLGRPYRCLVLGGPGSGKSTLLRAIAHELAFTDQLAILLNAEVLYRLDPELPTDQLIGSLCPREIDESFWFESVTAGHVLIMLDGVNEMEARFNGTDHWRMVLRLLHGPHQFPAIGVSRFIPDTLVISDDPEIDVFQLVPFAKPEIDSYLQLRGLDSHAAEHEFRAAGVSTLLTTPLLLKLAVDHLLDESSRGLPKSRAALFWSASERAVKNSATIIPRHFREAGFSLHTVFCAAAFAAIGVEAETISPKQLVAILETIWPMHSTAQLHFLVEGIAQHHLIIAENTPTGLRLRLLHPTLAEFGLALAWRKMQPPDWLIGRRTGEQFLGNWVGLQKDFDFAAEQAVLRAIEVGRPGLLVDVLMSNEGVLNDRTIVAGWRKLGEFLGPSASPWMRKDASEMLGRLDSSAAHRAIRSGLLEPLSQDAPWLAGYAEQSLLEGRFSAETWQSTIRANSNTARGRTGAKLVPDNASTKTEKSNSDIQYDGSELNDEKTLLRNIANPEVDPIVRRNAITSLAWRGNRECLPQIRNLLRDKSVPPHLQGAAAWAAGKLTDIRAVHDLISLLMDQTVDPITRGAAAKSLGQIADDRAIEALISAINDPLLNYIARSSAVQALSVIGHYKSVPTLIAALNDSTLAGGARVSAAIALGRMQVTNAIAPLIRASHDRRLKGSNVIEALSSFDTPEAIDAIIQIASDHKVPTDQRVSAITALGKIKEERCLTFLHKILKSKASGKELVSAAISSYIQIKRVAD